MRLGLLETIFGNRDTDKAEAAENFNRLIQALANVGLATKVRMGDKHSLLVFIKEISDAHLYGEVYRSRYVRHLKRELR